jgi:hypothetical protein
MRITLRAGALAAFLGLVLLANAEVTTPAAHFGFTPGEDYKLADFEQIASYFQKVGQQSDRLQWVEFGRSSEGRPMYVAFISSPENLRRLAEYRDISRKLALGQATEEEAARLVSQGKVIVWIDSGLHATEVAPSQHAPELAYRIVTGETPELRLIRDKVILMQVPVINPDGLEMVAQWYRRNVGTPHELSPLPWLYQKYSGHDNNRDWFMLNLTETRHVTRLLFQEWFPQIVYNQHQMGSGNSVRMFVPPYADPQNPNIPAQVMEGIHLIGAAMRERLSTEGKTGVLSFWGFDAWWNGGLRSAPAFHNMHGVLTETALFSYATPKTYKVEDFPARFSNGLSAKQSSVFYQRPWTGGRWGVRECIDYILSTDFALLELAARRSETFLKKAWEMGRANIDAAGSGGPYAYVLPPDAQWDRSSTLEFLARLQAAGVEIHQLRAPWRVFKGVTHPAGSYVVRAGQPFRGYVLDLFEPQKYPELRANEAGQTVRPYDITGWTLAMQMGVHAVRVDQPAANAEPLAAPSLELLEEVPRVQRSLDRRENASFRTTAELLRQGLPVRWDRKGAILTRESGAAFSTDAAWEVQLPRVGLYEPWMPNYDAGWTQWVFDAFGVPYTVLRNADFAAEANLRERFDTIVLPSQESTPMLNGHRLGEPVLRPGSLVTPVEAAKSYPRPEFAGGIGTAGLAQLEQFVRAGGTLIALNEASTLLLNSFPLPVRNVARGGRETFHCPGALLRIQVDTTHPLAFGMPADAIAFSTGGFAFELPPSSGAPMVGGQAAPDAHSVAKYAGANLLASGWISGEHVVLGKDVMVEVRLGAGRVVLYGIRPQFRGQPFGTFKLLLNAVYLGSAKPLGVERTPQGSARQQRQWHPSDSVHTSTASE